MGRFTDLAEEQIAQAPAPVGRFTQLAQSSGTSVPSFSMPKPSAQNIGLKALELMDRPANALRALVTDITDRGQFTPFQDIKRGLKNEQYYSGGKILENLFGKSDTKARKVAAFGTEMLLDPLWLVGGGIGKGAQIATKAGTKTLTRSGTRLLKSATKKSVPEIERVLATKGITRANAAVRLAKPIAESGAKNFDEFLKIAAGKKAEREIGRQISKGAAKLVDQGGFKIGGKSLVSGEKISRAGQKIAELPGVKTVRGLFSRDAGLVSKTGKEFGTVKQRFLDTQGANVADTVDEVKGIFKGITKEADRSKVAMALERGPEAVRELPPPLRSAAVQMRTRLQKIAKAEKRAGILDTQWQDYVPHIYDIPPEKVRRVYGGSGGGVKPSFAKERKIPTIEEGLKLFTEGKIAGEPVTDAAQALAVRGLASRKALTEKSFLEEVGQKFGKEKADLVGDVVEYRHKGVGKSMYIPREIADDLEQMFKGSSLTPAAQKLLKGYDKVQNFFKGSVTALFPGFHVRNAASNVALNFLDLGMDAINPVRHAQAWGVVAGRSGRIATKTGRVYTYDQIRKLARKFGMDTSGFYGGEIADEVSKQIKRATGAGRVSKIKEVVPFTRDFGGNVEHQAKLVNFISNLRKGKLPEEAARHAKQFIFDYNNLSGFERNFMRRAIPFYTFSRKNLGLHLRMLAKDPAKIALYPKLIRLVNKLADGGEATPEEVENMPGWIRDSIAVRMGTDEYGRPKYMTGMGLPAEEAIGTVEQIKDIFTGDKQERMKALSRGAFVPKYLAERTFGKDTFRGQDIESIARAPDWFKDLPDLIKKKIGYKESTKDVYVQGVKTGSEVYPTANPEFLHFLRNIPTSRFQSTIESLNKKDMTAKEKLFKLLTGVKQYTVDIDQQKFFNEKEALQKQAEPYIRSKQIREMPIYYAPGGKKNAPADIQAILDLLNAKSKK